MQSRSVRVPATRCAECKVTFPRVNRGKKFCSETCKSRHNVQRVINQLTRTTCTITEAADYYGCSVSTIRYRIKRRGIETFNLGRNSLMRQSDMIRLFH